MPRFDPSAPDRGLLPGLVHELRNHSFALSGSLDALGARAGRREETVRFERIMRQSLERLDALLDELGRYGEAGPAPEWPVDLEALLREAAARRSDRARAAGAALAVAVRGPLPPVLADPHALAGALDTLLDLALGEPGPETRVDLEAWATERGARGRIAAPALSLAGADPERLFQPFQARPPGLGRLALPLAWRTFRRHRGALWAAPEPEGGLRLEFALPGAPP